MNRVLAGWTVGTDYEAQVISTSPLAFWHLDEISGSTAYDSKNGYTGTYTGTTAANYATPFNTVSHLWGTGAYCTIYSPSLSSAFSWDEGCLMVWARVSGASVWTDSTLRSTFTVYSGATGVDIVRITKSSTNNTVSFTRKGNNVEKTVTISSFNPTAWFCLGLSWSVASGETKAYINGNQTGATQTSTTAASTTGIYTGNSTIGAVSNSGGNPWDGNIAHVAIWSRPIDSQIQQLMRYQSIK